MPNHLLCDELYVRISVLVHTCTDSSNVKTNLVQSKRHVSLVICVGLFGFVSCTVPCRILGRSGAP